MSRSAEADTSHTPISMRNHTGKCQAAKACAHPLVSENLDQPWLANTQTRNNVGTHSAMSTHGIFFTERSAKGFPIRSHLAAGIFPSQTENLYDVEPASPPTLLGCPRRPT